MNVPFFLPPIENMVAKVATRGASGTRHGRKWGPLTTVKKNRTKINMNVPFSSPFLPVPFSSPPHLRLANHVPYMKRLVLIIFVALLVVILTLILVREPIAHEPIPLQRLQHEVITVQLFFRAGDHGNTLLYEIQNNGNVCVPISYLGSEFNTIAGRRFELRTTKLQELHYVVEISNPNLALIIFDPKTSMTWPCPDGKGGFEAERMQTIGKHLVHDLRRLTGIDDLNFGYYSER